MHSAVLGEKLPAGSVTGKALIVLPSAACRSSMDSRCNTSKAWSVSDALLNFSDQLRTGFAQAFGGCADALLAQLVPVRVIRLIDHRFPLTWPRAPVAGG